MRSQFLAKLFFRPYQEHLHARIVAYRKQGSFNFRSRGPIRPHGIDSDNSFHGPLRLLRFFDFQNFAAFVIAALGTGAMRELALVAVGALGNRGGGQIVMGAAPRGAGFRVPPFWIWHFCFNLPGARLAAATHNPISLCLFVDPVFCECLPAPTSAGQTWCWSSCSFPRSNCGRNAGTVPCSFRGTPASPAKPAAVVLSAHLPAAGHHPGSSRSPSPLC